MLKSKHVMFGVAAQLMAIAGCTTSGPGQNTKGEPVAVADLPAAVVSGVQQAMPGAVIPKARRQSDGNYHLSDVKLGSKEYTLTVAPNGTIIKKEDDND